MKPRSVSSTGSIGSRLNRAIALQNASGDEGHMSSPTCPFSMAAIIAQRTAIEISARADGGMEESRKFVLLMVGLYFERGRAARTELMFATRSLSVNTAFTTEARV